jgi:hypothetical protein
MPNEGYRERLEKWEKNQKKLQEETKDLKPYDPLSMRSRAPLGCILATIAFFLSIVYTLYRLAKFGTLF